MPAAAGIIGAGTSLIGGILGSGAASKAAEQQAASQQAAIAETNAAKSESLNRESGLYNSETAALAPGMAAGTGALTSLAKGTAPGGEFTGTPTSSQVMANDPGYQFNLNQGQAALQRAEAAGGNVGSGGALKAGVQYASDYTTGAYQNAYNQFMSTRQSNYNNLYQLAGLGQNANSQFLNATQNYGGTATGVDQNTAGQVGGYLTGQGNANAAGTVGSANAWSGALSGIAKSATGLPQTPTQPAQTAYNTWNPATGTSYGASATPAPGIAPAYNASGYGKGNNFNENGAY
jgi:hypothetical protein